MKLDWYTGETNSIFQLEINVLSFAILKKKDYPRLNLVFCFVLFFGAYQSHSAVS
jgi:hypothetical protein